MQKELVNSSPEIAWSKFKPQEEAVLPVRFQDPIEFKNKPFQFMAPDNLVMIDGNRIYVTNTELEMPNSWHAYTKDLLAYGVTDEGTLVTFGADFSADYTEYKRTTGDPFPTIGIPGSPLTSIVERPVDEFEIYESFRIWDKNGTLLREFPNPQHEGERIFPSSIFPLRDGIILMNSLSGKFMLFDTQTGAVTHIGDIKSMWDKRKIGQSAEVSVLPASEAIDRDEFGLSFQLQETILLSDGRVGFIAAKPSDVEHIGLIDLEKQEITILFQNDNGHLSHLRELPGNRLVYAQEVNKGKRLGKIQLSILDPRQEQSIPHVLLNDQIVDLITTADDKIVIIVSDFISHFDELEPNLEYYTSDNGPYGDISSPVERMNAALQDLERNFGKINVWNTDTQPKRVAQMRRTENTNSSLLLMSPDNRLIELSSEGTLDSHEGRITIFSDHKILNIK